MKKPVLLLIILSLGLVVAMLFINVSKHLSNEVLDSFGIMNTKFETANTNSSNELSLVRQRVLLKESPEIQKQAKTVEQSSVNLYNYIENIKEQMLVEVNMDKDNMDFAVMDKSSLLLFNNDRKIGNEFVSCLNTYRTQMVKFGENSLNENFNNFIKESFKTDHTNTTDWLSYEFSDFPVIASYTKLTAIQNDINKAQLLAFKILLKE
ncbi:MAG: hypothetical protein QNK89_05140 [Lacinutrix sp.]|uniref:hypothetical protein n=1 Tax=Lacinutrix sp. TaxID=1937692 RepID=UPI00309E2859